MGMVSEYIRNIAVFLVFSSFITIIMPGKLYEPYVKLVLGIVLIFLIAQPLAGAINAIAGSSGDIFSDMALTHERAIMAAQIEVSSNEQIEAIISAYTQSLTQQLGRIVENNGFYLHGASFEIDKGDDFGEILKIQLTVAEQAPQTSLISIDPIRIAPALGSQGQPQDTYNDESPRIISLKNAISYFYNLPMDNIILDMR